MDTAPPREDHPFNKYRLLAVFQDKNLSHENWSDGVRDAMALKAEGVKSRLGQNWEEEVLPTLEEEGVSLGILEPKARRPFYSYQATLEALVCLGDSFEEPEIAEYFSKIMSSLVRYNRLSKEAIVAYSKGDRQDLLFQATEGFVQKLLAFTKKRKG